MNQVELGSVSIDATSLIAAAERVLKVGDNSTM